MERPLAVHTDDSARSVCLARGVGHFSELSIEPLLARFDDRADKHHGASEGGARVEVLMHGLVIGHEAADHYLQAAWDIDLAALCDRAVEAFGRRRPPLHGVLRGIHSLATPGDNADLNRVLMPVSTAAPWATRPRRQSGSAPTQETT